MKFTNLSEKQRKYIKVGLDVGLYVLILGGLLAMYDTGIKNGKLELCHDMDGVLVEWQGLQECWPQDQYDTYMEQWNTEKYLDEEIANGLQFNIS